MNMFIQIIKSFLPIDGKKEEKIELLYEQSNEKLKDLNKSLKKMNKLLCHKSVTNQIVKAMGN